MSRFPFSTLLSAVLLVGLVTSLGFALTYQYFSNVEETVFGDIIRFWHGDTLDGPVRSNGMIAIGEDPQFNDLVISCADDVWHGPSFNPYFAYPPFGHADSLLLPRTAYRVRDGACAQNHFYVGDDSLLARVRLDDHNLHVWWIRRFPPLDTLLETDYPLADSAVVFFDFPQVNLFGTLSSILILGASGRIGLEDNVLYASADPLTGRAPAGHAEKLMVVAEGEIKVLNTIANGRENSNGLGLNQTDPAYSSIVLDGVYEALGGSFTFENQNDPDSGYVYAGSPDNRGTISLYGSLYQNRRGYTHRATRGSTGYLKNYRYDADLKFWKAVSSSTFENVFDRSVVDFGDIAVGDTARDTLTFENMFVPVYFASDTLPTAAPFTAQRAWEPWETASHWSMHARFALSFAPTVPGVFETTLEIPIPYYGTTVTATLHGRCTVSGVAPRVTVPQAFTLAAFPNPFNAQTRIAFSLPEAGAVTLAVYDVTGREIATLVRQALAAGHHETVWDAAGNTSGVYFVRLTTLAGTRTTKLLLLK